MLRSFKALNTATAYTHPAVVALTEKLITALDSELTAIVYEEGSDVEAATLELEEAMNLADTEKENQLADGEEDET